MSDEHHRIEAMLCDFPDGQRSALLALRASLLDLLPGGIEAIAWGMPTVKVGPDQVVSYSGFAQHNSLFPGPEVAAAIASEFPDVETTKGTVHVDRNRPASMKLIRRVVALRLHQINDSYPRANGKTRRYFTNGFTEYTGSIRDGEHTRRVGMVPARRHDQTFWEVQGRRADR